MSSKESNATEMARSIYRDMSDNIEAKNYLDSQTKRTANELMKQCFLGYNKKVFLYDNGFYHGEVLNGRRNGAGVYVWPKDNMTPNASYSLSDCDFSAYFGQWKDNVKNGRGLYVIFTLNPISITQQIQEYCEGNLASSTTIIQQGRRISTSTTNRETSPFKILGHIIWFGSFIGWILITIIAWANDGFWTALLTGFMLIIPMGLIYFVLSLFGYEIGED